MKRTYSLKHIASTALLALVTLAVPHSLSAGFVVHATHEGEPVTNVRLCYHPGGPPDEILSSGLRGGRVQCASAAEEIEIPPGWAYIFADAESLTSAWPQSIEVGTAKRGRLKFALIEAVTIDLSRAVENVPAGAQLFVYSDYSGHDAFPAFRPLPEGERRLQVPAGSAVVPLIVRNRVPVAVGATIRTRPDEVARASFAAEGHTLLVPLMLARGLSAETKNALRASRSVPRVRLVAAGGGKELLPDFPLRPAPRFHRSLIVFRGAPPGNYELVVDGAGWKETRRPITIPRHPSVMVEQTPLVATPASRLTVHWSLDERVASHLNPPDCTAANDELQKGIELSVRRCPGQPWNGPPAACKVVESRPLDGIAGEESFELDEAGGSFLVYIRAGPARRTENVTVPTAGESAIALPLDATVLPGSVRKGQDPAHAYVRFGNSEAVTDPETGEFAAVFGDVSRWAPVHVTACDRAWNYTFIPDREIARESRLDIVVPENSLQVRVVDRATGVAVEKAKVTVFAVGGEERDLEMGHRTSTTDRSGASQFVMLPVDRKITACAGLQGFDSECIRDFEVGPDESRTIELRLVPQGMKKGRIVPPPVTPASLFVVNRGVERGRATVEADGSFLIRSPEAGDVLVLASPAFPLQIFATAAVENDEIVLHFTSTPGRRVTVVNGSDSVLHLTLEIDGTRLPQRIVAVYAKPPVMSPHAALAIEPLPVSREIVVIAFSSSDEVLQRAYGGGDPFTTPALEPLLRKARPDASGNAVFGQ